MKKFFALLIAFAITTGFAAAEKTKVHGFGISVPIESQFWHNDDVLNDTTFSSVGLNLAYKSMSMHGESFVGFSGIYEMQLGYFWGSTDNTDYNWFDCFNLKWGWGIAFRPTEKIILATHGTLGFDFKLLWAQDDAPYPDFTTRTGWDFVFVYKLKDNLGISLGFDIYVPIIGIGLDNCTELKWDSYYRRYEEKDSTEVFTIDGGFGCDFKFGLCWVY